eukprot:3506591-Rhodomonas_salina.1
MRKIVVRWEGGAMARALGRWEENVAESRRQQQVEKVHFEELEREREALESQVAAEQEKHTRTRSSVRGRTGAAGRRRVADTAGR